MMIRFCVYFFFMIIVIEYQIKLTYSMSNFISIYLEVEVQSIDHVCSFRKALWIHYACDHLTMTEYLIK